MLMPFGFDPVKLALKELLKVDIDRDGYPDLYEALDLSVAGLDALAEFFDGFEDDEAETILLLLNNLRKPANRKSPEQIKEWAQKVPLIAPGLRAAKAALDKAEASLKD
jgi:hypothetical protein